MPVDFYYFKPSCPCQAILMLVKTLNMDINLKETNLMAGEHKTPEFTKMNPQRSIPTLNDNGFVLWESRAILGYLAEQYGKDDSLYPKDPKKRALVNQRLYFDFGTLNTKFTQYYVPIIYSGKNPDPSQIDAFAEPLEFLDKFLEGQEWVAGKNITIADYAIVSTVANMEGVGYDMKKHSNVARWYEKTKKSISSYNEVMGPGISIFLDILQNAVKK